MQSVRVRVKFITTMDRENYKVIKQVIGDGQWELRKATSFNRVRHGSER